METWRGQTNKLVGILTNRDLRFETDRKRKVSEVMTKENLVIAPEGTDLKKAEKILRQYKIEKLPVVNKQGKLIGLITYRDILQLSAFPNAVKDKIGRLLVGAALGITKDLLDRAAALQSVGVDIVSLDSPMGSAALKGCHEVQNIGAVETYQRRYLWVTAMEIVEHDALDSSEGVDELAELKAHVAVIKASQSPAELKVAFAKYYKKYKDKAIALAEITKVYNEMKAELNETSTGAA